MTTTDTAIRYFVAVPAGHQTAIFGAGTSKAEAIADASRWGDPSDKPVDDVWKALPATKVLHDLVCSQGAPASWSEITVDGQDLQCTVDEQEAIEIAEDILEAVGESIDGGSELGGWTGEGAIDAYAEGSDWEDDVNDRPALRTAVAARIDATLAEWRAEFAA
jgi:hypothetical protein